MLRTYVRYVYFFTYLLTDGRTGQTGHINYWTDLCALSGALFFCVLHVCNMTPSQEKAYQEAVARAKAHKTTGRAYAIKYGR